jgi:polar amino acid transport system permease protein
MSLILDNMPLFLRGLLATLQIGVVTLIASTIIGFILGTLAVTRSRLLRLVVRGYVELLRAVPLIVNIFFIFFGAPLFGLQLTPYAAAVIGLSLWGGANGAEIVRGGLLGVPRHQAQSARALGMTEPEIFIQILLPQAMRAIIPAFAGLLTLLVQSTTLGALVGVPEFLQISRLVVERTTVMQGIDPAFQIYAFVLVIYFLLCSTLSFASRWLEGVLAARGGSRKTGTAKSLLPETVS